MQAPLQREVPHEMMLTMPADPFSINTRNVPHTGNIPIYTVESFTHLLLATGLKASTISVTQDMLFSKLYLGWPERGSNLE